MIRTSAPARTALVGNPSDGYGGAVLTMAVDNWGATVELHPIEGEADRFEGAEGLQQLARAARARCRREGWPVPAASVAVTSDIPREVGLAGSSAVIVATLQATALAADIDPPDEILPALALRIETDDLGIPGGLQDRIAQVHRGVVRCELAEDDLLWLDGFEIGAVTRLTPELLPPLAIAWLPTAGESSATPHSDLRGRWDRGDATVRAGIARLADLARRAARDLSAGDVGALGPAMTASYELRAAMMPLHPSHVGLVEAARGTGAHVNYSGSGGAVVTTVPTGGLDQLVAAVAPVGASVELIRTAGPVG
ncbi:MAG: hypothetical protein AAGD18_04870 [Actinomycetota bacterium]